jgi:hypothetical protein
MENYRRILTELVSFATYVAVEEEAGKYLTKMKMVVVREPDPEKIETFAGLLHTDLENHLGQYIRELKEIEVVCYQPYKLGEGEPLSVTRIIYKYLRSMGGPQVKELFIDRVSFAIDPHMQSYSRRIAEGLYEKSRKVAQEVTQQVFSYKAPMEEIEKRM